MIGGRRHDTLVNRGASRVRECEIDMTTRQMFFVIALVTGAIILVGFNLFQWLSPTQRALKWATRGDSDRAIDWLNTLIERRPSSPALHIHVAMALGGKGLLFMTGSVADVRAGVQSGLKPVRDRGLLVSQVVIPRPSPELFEEYI